MVKRTFFLCVFCGLFFKTPVFATSVSSDDESVIDFFEEPITAARELPLPVTYNLQHGESYADHVADLSKGNCGVPYLYEEEVLIESQAHKMWTLVDWVQDGVSNPIYEGGSLLPVQVKCFIMNIGNEPVESDILMAVSGLILICDGEFFAYSTDKMLPECTHDMQKFAYEVMGTVFRKYNPKIKEIFEDKIHTVLYGEDVPIRESGYEAEDEDSEDESPGNNMSHAISRKTFCDMRG